MHLTNTAHYVHFCAREKDGSRKSRFKSGLCYNSPLSTESASRLEPVLDTFHNIISIVPSPMSWVQYVVDSTSKYYTDLVSYVDRSSIISGCVVI